MVTNNSINLKDSGITAYDGAGIFHGRTLAPPAEGITISNADGVSGNPTFALANDLAALEGLVTTGIAARTGTSTWETRTLTAGTGVSISNADGVSGNPTISATTDIATTYTTDSGTATAASHNLNVLGTSAQGLTSSASGDTITLTMANADSVQKGVASFDNTNFSCTAGNVTSNAMTVTAGTGLSGGGSFNLGGSVSVALSTPVSVSNGGTGASTLGSHGVLYGNGTGAVGVTTAGTDGQVFLGGTSSAPAFATLTGSNGITYTPGTNSLNIGNSNIPNSALQNSSITLSNGAGISISGSPVSLGGTATISASASVPTTFNADSGSATPALNALTLAGTSAQGLSTSATGSTVTFTNADWTTTQKGVGTLATNAETIAGSLTTKAITPDDLKAKLGAQTTHGLPIGASSTSALTWTANPTAGQLLIGVGSGSDPALGTLTQPAAGLTITNGSGTITFALANDLAAVEGLSTTGLATRTATDTWTTRTVAASTGISVSNGDGVSGNPTVSADFSAQAAGSTAVVTLGTSGNTILVENRAWTTRYIVDPSSSAGTRGTYTTISAAITQAVADGAANATPKTIFIREGTYAENVANAAGIKLVGYIEPNFASAASQANTGVIINGTMTFASGGYNWFDSIYFNNASNFTFNNNVIQFKNCVVGAFTQSDATVITAIDSTLNGTITLSGTSSSAITGLNCSLGTVTHSGSAKTTFYGGGLFGTYTMSNSSAACTWYNGGFSSQTMFNGTSGTVNLFNCCASNTTGIICGGSITANMGGLTIPARSATSTAIYSSTNTKGLYQSLCGNIYLARRVAGDITVTSKDYYLGVTDTTSARTVTLPTTSTTVSPDQVFIIKDESGGALTHNITLACTVDGVVNPKIITNYGSFRIIWNGSTYFSF